MPTLAEAIVQAGAVRKWGWLPDKLDKRDLLYGRTTTIDRIPKKVNMRRDMTPVENQGFTSSCVAQAAVGAMEYLYVMKILGKRWPCLRPRDYSRLFVYWYARELDGFEGEDGGCYIRSAIKAMVKFGVCKEKYWEFGLGKMLKQPNEEARDKAKRRKITSYHRVAIFEDFLCALADHIPVVFGAQIFNSFIHTSDGNISMPDLEKDTYAGAHAMLAVGYDLDKKVVIVRNSWGRKWGKGGYCFMPIQYFQIGSYVSDCWVIRAHPKN